MPDTRNRNIYCKLQNRLGALDRVLLALTHRGIVPERFVTAKDEATNTLEVAVTFQCEEGAMVEKLVKFLQKQVYVLEAASMDKAVNFVTAPSNVAPLFINHDEYELAHRRVAHAHNA